MKHIINKIYFYCYICVFYLLVNRYKIFLKVRQLLLYEYLFPLFPISCSKRNAPKLTFFPILKWSSNSSRRYLSTHISTGLCTANSSCRAILLGTTLVDFISERTYLQRGSRTLTWTYNSKEEKKNIYIIFSLLNKVKSTIINPYICIII